MTNEQVTTGPKRKRWLRVAKMLGLPPSNYPAERRGFVAVQIDGLGYYIYAKLLLAGIDDRIRLIARAAQRFHSRPYDLFVLSDHRMSTTVPFDANSANR